MTPGCSASFPPSTLGHVQCNRSGLWKPRCGLTGLGKGQTRYALHKPDNGRRGGSHTEYLVEDNAVYHITLQQAASRLQ
jgi:hypothetical protein